MLDKKFIDLLKKDYSEKSNQRRQIISTANIILNNSKKAIFAIHRDEMNVAEEKLIANEDSIEKLSKNFGSARIVSEGAFMAALEEYAEAKLFFNFVKTGKIGKIKEAKLPLESYLGGLCDFTGELVRRAVNESINKNFAEVKKIKNIVNEILNELIDFDITGYLRTKYDQAKGNLKKIEQMDYEISLKNL